MWEVILGGVLVIVGTIIVQLIQNYYQNKKREISVLYEIGDILLRLEIQGKLLRDDKDVSNQDSNNNIIQTMASFAIALDGLAFRLSSKGNIEIGEAIINLCLTENYLDSTKVEYIYRKIQKTTNKKLHKKYDNLRKHYNKD